MSESKSIPLLPASSSPATPKYQPLYPIRFWRTFLLRSYAMLPVLAGIYVTTSTLESMAYQMSITSAWGSYNYGTIDSQYIEIVGFNDYNRQDSTGFRVYDCHNSEGDVPNPDVTVSCEITLANSLKYRALFASWVAYFAVLFLYHFYNLWGYDACDLRFHISYAKANSSRYERAYILVGIFFTLVTVVLGVVEAASSLHSSTEGNFTICVLFGIINISLLRRFLVNNFKHMENVDMKRDFPQVIYVDRVPRPEDRSLFNLYGTIIPSEKLFKEISDAMCRDSLAGGNGDRYLSELGDAAEIMKAMRIIYKTSE